MDTTAVASLRGEKTKTEDNIPLHIIKHNIDYLKQQYHHKRHHRSRIMPVESKKQQLEVEIEHE
jgi:hypothetical protein